jgi:hypothetical protein
MTQAKPRFWKSASEIDRVYNGQATDYVACRPVWHSHVKSSKQADRLAKTEGGTVGVPGDRHLYRDSSEHVEEPLVMARSPPTKQSRMHDRGLLRCARNDGNRSRAIVVRYPLMNSVRTLIPSIPSRKCSVRNAAMHPVELSRSGCQVSYAVLMLTPPSTAQVWPVT